MENQEEHNINFLHADYSRIAFFLVKTKTMITDWLTFPTSRKRMKYLPHELGYKNLRNFVFLSLLTRMFEQLLRNYSVVYEYMLL